MEDDEEISNLHLQRSAPIPIRAASGPARVLQLRREASTISSGSAASSSAAGGEHEAGDEAEAEAERATAAAEAEANGDELGQLPRAPLQPQQPHSLPGRLLLQGDSDTDGPSSAGLYTPPMQRRRRRQSPQQRELSPHDEEHRRRHVDALTRDPSSPLMGREYVPMLHCSLAPHSCCLPAGSAVQLRAFSSLFLLVVVEYWGW